MWHSLPHEAREVIEDLRHRHGDRLYDYLRTELGPNDAKLALACTLVSACVHAERVADDEHLLAWLYGLARAHRASAIEGGSAVHADPPLSEATTGLSSAHREVLDLALRHGLSGIEIALIFDAGAVEVELLLDEAREHWKTWLATADKGDLRSADPLEMLPLLNAPHILTEQLLKAEPLGDDPAQWRSDGFPAQPSLLPDARHAPSVRCPAAANDTLQQPFRSWEQRSSHIEEFWRRRPDESDPEARLSLRPLVPALRVCLLIIAVVTGVSLIGMAWSELHSTSQPHAATPAAETVTLIATHPPGDPAIEEPPLIATSTPVPQRTESSPDGPIPRPSVIRTTSRSTTAKKTSRQLPKPAAPSVRVVPANISLGSLRTGSFTLKVSRGSARIVDAFASEGIVVDGTRFIVSAPLAKPGCSSSSASGTITLTWRATNTGDGRTSAGTTTATGSATIHVSWTIEADKGIWMPTGQHMGSGQGHWSNCPNGPASSYTLLERPR